MLHHLTLRVASPHRLHEVATHHAALVAVVHGVKQVFAGGRVQRFAAGTLVLMPGGLRWEIANTPGDNGWYVAEVLVLSPEVLSRFGQQFAAQCAAARVPKGAVGLTLAGDLADAFERVTAVAASKASEALRMHRALELLLLLAEAGWAFAPPQAQRWVDRVQALVAHQPDWPWTLAEIAARLALGPSSLQRRLREEGSTLQACVRQGRMDAALGLLQTTDWPVSQVALACGYASHGRFSAAFAQRFGVPPSQLRAGP
jgi:AraC-like DNA-binding protein